MVIDSWKFTMLLLYILWDDWPIFMVSASNEQLQQQLGYTLLNPDCHKWWTSKMKTDTLEEQYAIKFCSKLEKKKMAQKRIECFRLFFDHLAWIEHQFLNGIRDSRNAGSLWGMMRGVGGVRKSIYQSWLAKGLGLGLLCWSFKWVQEEIPSENRVSGISTRTIHQSITPSLSQTFWARWASRQFFTVPIVQTLLPVTSGCRYETIEEMKEAVRKSLTRSHKRTSIGPSRSCWNGTTSALQPEEITSKGTRVPCVCYIITEGFRFMPLSLVRLRTFRLST